MVVVDRLNVVHDVCAVAAVVRRDADAHYDVSRPFSASG